MTDDDYVVLSCPHCRTVATAPVHAGVRYWLCDNPDYRKFRVRPHNDGYEIVCAACRCPATVNGEPALQH